MSRRRFLCISPDSQAVRVFVAAAAIASLCATGCVQRRMTIRSNVPGAQVYVDNYEIGRTPVSTDFIYYGQRDIRLVKDGYETLKVKQSLNAPWYQYPGIDFLVENVWPFELRDERNFNYQMQPQYLVPTETILSRAEEMRSRNAAALAAPVVAEPAAVQPSLVPLGTVQPYVAQPGTMPPPSYTAPPAGASPVVPSYPAQPNPYAPQPATGAPRL